MKTEKLTIDEHMNITNLAHELYARKGGKYARKRSGGTGFNPELATSWELFEECMNTASALTSIGKIAVELKTIDLIESVISEELGGVEFSVNMCYIKGRGELPGQINQLKEILKAKSYWRSLT